MLLITNGWGSFLETSAWSIAIAKRRWALCIEEVSKAFWADTHNSFDDLSSSIEDVLCRIVLISCYFHLLEEYWKYKKQNQCNNDSENSISDILYCFLDDVVFSVWENELKDSAKKRVDSSGKYDNDEYSQHGKDNILYSGVVSHPGLYGEENKVGFEKMILFTFLFLLWLSVLRFQCIVVFEKFIFCVSVKKLC